MHCQNAKISLRSRYRGSPNPRRHSTGEALAVRMRVVPVYLILDRVP